jgi:serpin B
MHFLLKGVIITIGLTLASCQMLPPHMCPAVKAEDAKQAEVAMADFAINLFKTVSAKDEDKNQVMSPVSIALALALIENGANGKTHEELKRVLVEGSSTEVLKAYRAVESLLSIDTEKTKLHVANAMFKQDDLHLKESFLRTVRDCFKTQVDTADFKTKLEETRQKINKYISEKTMNKIPDLFKPGVLTKDDRMVLANAVYFKSSWAKSFNTKNTQPGTFYRLGREEQTVPFMHQPIEARHGETNDVEALEMHYEHRDLGMYILLPKQRDGLRNLEKRITGKELREIMSKLDEKLVEVKLPKFTIRSPVDLKPTLIKLGLESMFSNAANFSRMSDTQLKVDSAVHEAYIDVNENGTEAAAATGMSFMPKAMPRPPMETTPFVADHPFLYAIVHKQTGAIVFLGKVNSIDKHEN